MSSLATENGMYRSDCGDQPAEMKGEGMWLSQKQVQTDVADQRARGGCRLCLLLCRKRTKSCKGGLSALGGSQPVLTHFTTAMVNRGSNPWAVELLCGGDREHGPGRTAISFLRQFSLCNQGYSRSHYVRWL